MEIQYLKGIGEKRARLFAGLGLFSVEDLTLYVPRAYDDRTAFSLVKEICPGEYTCVRATVARPVSHAYIRKGLELYKTEAFDETGTLRLTFFNAPYVKTALEQGRSYVFYGKGEGEYGKQMTNPLFEPEEQAGRVTNCIAPVYRTTAGLPQGTLRAAVRQALDKTLDSIEELLPDHLRQAEQLCSLRFALENIHFPQSAEALELARRRLVFDELLLLQLGLAGRKNKSRQVPGLRFAPTDLTPFYQALPFTLTEGQQAAVEDIIKDTRSGFGMNRLIQGDVGSGKTVVAAAAAYLCCQSGYQALLMAPTEILAEQHAADLTPLFTKLGFRTGLLTGRGRAAARRQVQQGLAEGTIDFCIGTHALLSDSVNYPKLGLVITDEQHRFGVAQRAKLYDKGDAPHRLVMSATPIPRTLARILYGDLEVSVMRGMPPGRKPVKTYVVTEDYRARIHAFVRKLVQEGGQVYIVCPLIEDEEGLMLQSAADYAQKLSETVFPDLRIGLVHGKVKPKERESVMSRFADGELDVLVATTVIEVGVNVPNAVLMIVENAERFGLSQLHQLRGRVGRGEAESHCVLFLQGGGEVSRARMEVMCRTNDGFEIAEADLQLRGPGDFFGNRQHGLPAFRIADLSNDMHGLERSRSVAAALLAEDGELTQYAALRRAVEEMMARVEGGD